MRLRYIGVFVLILVLTGCGGVQVGNSNSAGIDFNADVKVIADAIAKFDANSKTSSGVKTYSDFVNIYDNNGVILNEVDSAADVFLTHINQASSSLPGEDSKESPSKTKLLAWANGYKTWVYYQKLNQNIGGVCVNRPADWMNCLIENLSENLDNEAKSTIDLKNAIQGIQEWRHSVGY